MFLKNQAKSYLTFIIIFIPIIFIYTYLLYTNKLSSSINSINITTLIIGIISFFILGFISANNHQKKGILTGLFASLFIIAIVLIINILSKENLEFKSYLKYLLLILSSSFGGMIGVNIKPLKLKLKRKNKVRS